MLDFVKAAFPWVIIGITIAVFAATRTRLKKQKADQADGKGEYGNYQSEGLCIGMCIGVAFGTTGICDLATGLGLGMLLGMMIGTSIQKPQAPSESVGEAENALPKLTVSSPAFEPEGWMPDRNSGYGEDQSPELHIEGITENAASMVITLDDLGHPIAPGYNHWVAWNLPPTRIVPEGLPKGAVVEAPLHMEQGVAYGKHCYRGPKPPFNWNHRYRFTVYALDTMLSVDTDSDKAAVLAAMDGHILQTGYLYGKYQRKHG